VQRLGGDDRPHRLVVDAGQQRVELVGREEQAVALVAPAVDRHPDVVQKAAGGDDDLGVVLGHRMRLDHGRADPAADEQPQEPQADVEHDLHVHPRVVGHVEPVGVDLLHVPPRLELGVVVGGVEEALEPAVAARGHVHAGGRRDGLDRLALGGRGLLLHGRGQYAVTPRGRDSPSSETGGSASADGAAPQ
jgi:hypothetical protein